MRPDHGDRRADSRLRSGAQAAGHHRRPRDRRIRAAPDDPAARDAPRTRGGIRAARRGGQQHRGAGARVVQIPAQVRTLLVRLQGGAQHGGLQRSRSDLRRAGRRRSDVPQSAVR